MPATPQVEEHQVSARIVLRQEEEADNPVTDMLARRGQDQAETLMQKAVEELWRMPKTGVVPMVALPLSTACMVAVPGMDSGFQIQTHNSAVAVVGTATEVPDYTAGMA